MFARGCNGYEFPFHFRTRSAVPASIPFPLAESLEKQQWERHDILDQEERTHPGPGGTFSVSFSPSHSVCALLLFDEGMNLVEDAFYWFVVVVALLL